MRYQYQSQGFKNDFYGNKNKFSLNAVNIIIGINIIIFFLFSNFSSINYYFGVAPTNFYPWQLITYMFLHGGIFHLAWNMFLLWMFGNQIESIWGYKKFIIYYLFTGVGSGLLIYLFSDSTTIGASGAIMAVLFAYGYTFPNRKVLFWFIPMKVKYCILILIGMELSQIAANDGISHIGHLGGMLMGFLYLEYKNKKILHMIGMSHMFESFVKIFKIKIHKGTKSQKHTKKTTNIDKILDKLKIEGWDGLTEEEKTQLFQASKEKQKNQHIN